MADESIISEARSKELNDIIDFIKTNAIHGNTSISKLQISPYAKKQLRSLGYTVWVHENSFTISWKKTLVQKIKELFWL